MPVCVAGSPGTASGGDPFPPGRLRAAQPQKKRAEKAEKDEKKEEKDPEKKVIPWMCIVLDDEYGGSRH